MPAQLDGHIDSALQFGKRLRERRLNLGMRQGDLSTQGVTVGYISRLESGDRMPSLQVVRHLASRLGVDEDWLARGEMAEGSRRIEFNHNEFITVVTALQTIAQQWGDPTRPIEILERIAPQTASAIHATRATCS